MLQAKGRQRNVNKKKVQGEPSSQPVENVMLKLESQKNAKVFNMVRLRAALWGQTLAVDFLALQLLRGNAEIKNSAKQAGPVCCEAGLITNASKANVSLAQTPSPVEKQGAQAHGRSLHHIKL